MKVRLEFEGVAPLIMHNVDAANPLNPIVKEIKKLTGNRKKTDEVLEEIARLEFEVSLYYLRGLGPVVPGRMVEASLVTGGRLTKSGKNVERGLFVTENEAPLIYTGPRTVEELWADEQFRLIVPVGVTGRKVMRCRPIFRDWRLEIEGEVDQSYLNLDDLRQIATTAGQVAAFGDWRPRYGRYTATIQEL